MAVVRSEDDEVDESDNQYALDSNTIDERNEKVENSHHVSNTCANQTTGDKL